MADGHELGTMVLVISITVNKFRTKQAGNFDTEKEIETITKIKTRLFAPPYGEYNDTTIKAADSLGYRTIMWSIDTIDWRRDGIDKIIHRVMKNPHNGALVLMHPTADTVSALPVIIEGLKNQGFNIGTVSDALKE